MILSPAIFLGQAEKRMVATRVLMFLLLFPSFCLKWVTACYQKLVDALYNRAKTDLKSTKTFLLDIRLHFYDKNVMSNEQCSKEHY